MNLIITENFRLSGLHPDDGTIDLGPIEALDAFGVVSLLCSIQTHGARQPQNLLLGRPQILQRLVKVGFFQEVKRRCQDRVTWNEEALAATTTGNNNDILTLVRYGNVSGDERRIANEFKEQLSVHGFSENLLCAGTVIIGEAGANSHTHSHCASHMMIDGSITPSKSLRIGIADIGQGVANALRGNTAHQGLDDPRTLLKALKTNVSGWPGVNRGKGLTEILKWTMSFKGTLRIDSNGRTIIIKCGGPEPTCDSSPCDDLHGTRVGIALDDGPFIDVSRKNADELATKLLERL